MDLFRLFALLFGVACAAFPAASCADDLVYLSDSALLGGEGGGDFREQCPDDLALTGVNVTIGTDINSIAPVCSPMTPGQSYDAMALRGTYGYAKDRPGYASCLPNLVQAMDVGTSTANIIHDLQLVCVAPDGGTHIAVILTADGSASLTPGGAELRNERTGCEPGAFAVGLFGRHGTHIDAVGLMCGTAAPPSQAGKGD